MNKIEIGKSAKRVIELLEAQGYEAYIVGGCVRDMLMGIEPHDYDITTSALPEEMKAVFASERVIETGIKHGTVTVIIDNEPIEITTYRLDGEYLDNRHPKSVEFTRDLREDLARRDFTVNAIAFNEKTGIVDPFGGISDIDNRIIRVVGDPYKRFEEDALRILRGLRFCSTLGFEIEENTLKAMNELRSLIKSVSKERIAEEINKLVMGKNVKKAILKGYELLGVICPELEMMHGFNQRNRWHIYDVLEHTAVAIESVENTLHLRLAALFHDTGKVHTFTLDENGVGHFYGHYDKSAVIVEEYLKEYKYDNVTRKEVYELVKHHDLYTEEDGVIIKKRLRRMGEERFLNLIKLQRADNAAQNPALTRMEHFDILEEMATEISNEECFDLSKLEINGKDLIEIGIERGEKIGRVLNALLEEVIEEKLPNEREALIKRAQEIKETA